MSARVLSIVVPIRNEAETLQEFLASLAAQTVPPTETVLVDAGSSDATPGMLRDYAARQPGVRVIDAGAAYPGRARNIGIRAATADWIALTDAGTILDANWLAELTRAADAAPDVDVVYGSYDPLLRTRFQRYVALSFLAPDEAVDGHRFRGPSTASMLLRRQVWNELGGFPEDLRACEDLLFFKRIDVGSYKTTRAPRATVTWRLPSTPAQVFRRFRTYSHHTLKAGLGATWHLSLVKMYLAAIGCIALGVVTHWRWCFILPVIGLAARAIGSVTRRSSLLRAPNSRPPNAWLVVLALLVWIDLAAMAGALDYAFEGKPTA